MDEAPTTAELQWFKGLAAVRNALQEPKTQGQNENGAR